MTQSRCLQHVLDYGGPALLRIIREKIGGPSLQSAYVTARSKFHTPTKLEESTFVKAASFYDRIGYHGPFIIAIDATAILPCIRVKGNKLIGIATEEDIVVKTAQDIIDITGNESMEKARLANAFVLTPLKEHVPSFVLAVSAVVKGQNFETVVNWFNSAIKWGAQQNLKILGIGVDGDSKFRKYYFERFLKRREPLPNVISIPHKGFNFVSVVEDIHGLKVPTLMFPDWKHLIKKWRNQILNVRRVLVLGNGYLMIEDLMRLYEGRKLASCLWKSDVFVRDRQNVDAAIRILQPQVRKCLQEWNDQRTEAIRIYLKIGYNMMRGYTEENLSVKERAKLAWTAVCFVRLWKAWIEMSSYTIESSFISLQTYNDMILAGHTLVISMKIFAEHFPDEHFHRKVFGSDSCERLFARLRGFYRGKSNLCMLDILDICGRILKLEELKCKDVCHKETPMSWSTTTEQDILSGLREAEREVLKTVERLGMLPLLTAGNILRKDKEGEITYLNPGMESTLTDIGFEPDELDSIPVEELIEAESDILCSVADEIDHSSAYALSDIAASAQTSRTTQAELLEDEDDDDDPSQCHLYQSGTCKYMDKNFRAPANTHWLGCDYPGCDNWFHESCLGVKFTSDFQRENYAFVCKAHDSVKDIFHNQVTAKATHYNILDEELSEVQPPSKRLRRTQYKSGSSLFNDQPVRPNYVEYEGEYYHIAEFLSLQQGKVYQPSTSRMSRWMAVSRSDFNERVEKIVSPNKTDSGLYLEDIAAFWVPRIGLKCGLVLRMLRKTSAKSEVPVFEWKKQKKKEETLKSSVCLLVLSATKIEVGKWSLSKTKEILWTECSSHLLTFHEVPEVRLWPVSVNAEHLEDMLPELEIAERERLLAEERRREEEKKKKKMGEPEDMSVRLLKEVLDDLNVTYKASEKKRDLIAKVLQARERLQESHSQQDAPCHFALYCNNDYTDDQSHWYDSCAFKASLFPLIYYDERKERFDDDDDDDTFIKVSRL